MVRLCLILLGMIFQVFEALTEKADRPDSVDLYGTTQLPLADALVFLTLLEYSDKFFQWWRSKVIDNAIHVMIPYLSVFVFVYFVFGVLVLFWNVLVGFLYSV